MPIDSFRCLYFSLAFGVTRIRRIKLCMIRRETSNLVDILGE